VGNDDGARNAPSHYCELSALHRELEIPLGRLALAWAPSIGRHVVESNEINTVALPVLCDLEQIDQPEETRLSRQIWSNIRETDRLDRIDLDFTLFHPIPRANFNVRARPNSHTASDFTAPNPVPKSFGEHHKESLQSAAAESDVSSLRSSSTSATSSARLSRGARSARGAVAQGACMARLLPCAVGSVGGSTPNVNEMNVQPIDLG